MGLFPTTGMRVQNLARFGKHKTGKFWKYLQFNGVGHFSASPHIVFGRTLLMESNVGAGPLTSVFPSGRLSRIRIAVDFGLGIVLSKVFY